MSQSIIRRKTTYQRNKNSHPRRRSERQTLHSWPDRGNEEQHPIQRIDSNSSSGEHRLSWVGEWSSHVPVRTTHMPWWPWDSSRKNREDVEVLRPMHVTRCGGTSTPCKSLPGPRLSVKHQDDDICERHEDCNRNEIQEIQSNSVSITWPDKLSPEHDAHTRKRIQWVGKLRRELKDLRPSQKIRLKVIWSDDRRVGIDIA